MQSHFCCRNSAVVGITSLGYDHVRVLGKTIEEIAWQKAGIIKPSSIVVTAANQPKTALTVLQSRAAEKGVRSYESKINKCRAQCRWNTVVCSCESWILCSCFQCTLYVAPDLSEYEYQGEIVLGIGGFVQRMNASLALQLANAWMNPQHYRRTSGSFARFQVFNEVLSRM